MGLDLVVEGCAKPGHEAEWRGLLELSFDGEEPTEENIRRFEAISVPAYQRIGAPRVGYDRAADEWIIEDRDARTPEAAAAVLKDFHGYYVLRLVESDGIPEYSHGGLYEGVDETSFRGAFLSDCSDVLGPDLVEEAWGHKFPEEAISYGRALLAAAGAAPRQPEPKRGLLSRFRQGKNPSSSLPVEEQLRIVEAAGRWFLFWGERGHAIRAWF